MSYCVCCQEPLRPNETRYCSDCESQVNARIAELGRINRSKRQTLVNYAKATSRGDADAKVLTGGGQGLQM